MLAGSLSLSVRPLPVGRYVPLGAASSYAALASTTAAATAFAVTAFEAEDATARPDAEVGDLPAVPLRSADASAGRTRFLGVRLPSAKRCLLITLFAGSFGGMLSGIT